MIIGTSGVENDMEIIIATFLLYFIARLLVQFIISVIEFCGEARRDRRSIKNRKIIRRYEWLQKIGCQEAAQFIVKRLR